MNKPGHLVLILAGTIFLVFHFTMLGLSVGPNNPVSVTHREAINQYKDPLFYQNWNLFAPEPISKNHKILVKYRTESGEESDWNDISTPILDSNQQNRFSAINRAARVPSGIFFSIYRPNDLVMAYRKKTGEEEATDVVNEEVIEQQRSEQIDALYRFANSSIPLLTDAGEVKEVNVRIMEVSPVPYSERNNPDYKREAQYIDFEWRDYFYVDSYDV
ncbi:hypothetical protein M662_06690 [Bacillus sp. SB49]|uniref:DUF5819 family protein n=1 Tax=Bacillaceae TaxID=186817 RepID=UPI0003FB994C|nr:MULTISPECIES: DUF5819 family protein [Bacillaceae]QHT46190.1 hypothetical protein M662_06690 [Bacillus sp. SB49]